MDNNKLEVVRKYLNDKFPKAEIKEKYDSDLIAQTFKIYNSGDLLLLKVDGGFLGGNNEKQIETLLNNRNIAELLENNNTQGVFVGDEPPTIFDRD